MMSLELLLDAATDARIRAEWTALVDADLPSQARHTGASNAPHITLLAAQSVSPTLRPAAAARHAAASAAAAPSAPASATAPAVAVAVAAVLLADATAARPQTAPAPGLEQGHGRELGLPIPVHLSGLIVFGGPPRGLVLARLVAVTADLALLHTSVHRRASGVEGLSEQTSPDHWTPHVTLASRLTPAQLASAIEVLAAHAEASAAVTPPAAAPVAPPVTPPSVAFAISLRHWNGDTKTVSTVIPPPS
ncbi:hypothetical protein C5B96_14315 [Subtercola sp. Z020]|uniref:2'-5' RNA ligase family protein n=1 Tax=Subtercola sp. Z020 TaxID=2080582 RepID=UPI000CE7248E|nr:2'-5' RNA ligase family protein [Subtercola sp. Z020]PPF78709.1 hypothetical protein C5B96_14315 [Subtercola sp. Z020]